MMRFKCIETQSDIDLYRLEYRALHRVGSPNPRVPPEGVQRSSKSPQKFFIGALAEGIKPQLDSN